MKKSTWRKDQFASFSLCKIRALKQLPSFDEIDRQLTYTYE